MTEFLQIVGSIASIGGIPLAIYLYLRSRQSRTVKVRREIVRTLSCQIGEGRDLSMFEVRSVIDSHTRHADGRCGEIDVEEVVEDLVAETIASPLLDRERKSMILNNLRNLHSRGQILAVIDRYRVSFRDLLSCLSSVVKLSEEDSQIIIRTPTESRLESPKRARGPLIDPEMFAWVGVVVSGLAFLGFFSGRIGTVGTRFTQFFEKYEYLISMSLGMFASLIAVAVSFFFSRLERKLSFRKQTDSESKRNKTSQQSAPGDVATRSVPDNRSAK